MLWYNILAYNSTWPTLPFIVGAYRHVFSKIDFSIFDLVNEIASTHVPDYEDIVLRKCSILDEFVIGKYPKYAVLYPSPLMLMDDRTVCYERSAVELGMDIDIVSKNLNEKYNSFLKKGLYSWDDTSKVWRSFNRSEISSIEIAAKLLDNPSSFSKDF